MESGNACYSGYGFCLFWTGFWMCGLNFGSVEEVLGVIFESWGG